MTLRGPFHAFVAAFAALSLQVGLYGARACPHHEGGETPAPVEHASSVDHADHGHAAAPHHDAGDHGSDHGACTCVGDCVGGCAPTSSIGSAGLAATPSPSAAFARAPGADSERLPPRLSRYVLPPATAPPIS